jgi:hypothetical protein
MGLYKGKINPLNLLSVRRLNRIPPNFTRFYLKELVDYRSLDRWIYLNLDGRYCVKKSTVIDNNRIGLAIEVGLEKPSELTLLTLACPHLQGTKFILSK